METNRDAFTIILVTAAKAGGEGGGGFQKESQQDLAAGGGGWGRGRDPAPWQALGQMLEPLMSDEPKRNSGCGVWKAGSSCCLSWMGCPCAAQGEAPGRMFPVSAEYEPSLGTVQK